MVAFEPFEENVDLIVGGRSYFRYFGLGLHELTEVSNIVLAVVGRE